MTRSFASHFDRNPHERLLEVYLDAIPDRNKNILGKEALDVQDLLSLTESCVIYR